MNRICCSETPSISALIGCQAGYSSNASYILDFFKCVFNWNVILYFDFDSLYRHIDLLKKVFSLYKICLEFNWIHFLFLKKVCFKPVFVVLDLTGIHWRTSFFFVNIHPLYRVYVIQSISKHFRNCVWIGVLAKLTTVQLSKNIFPFSKNEKNKLHPSALPVFYFFIQSTLNSHRL